jgi:RimJ/RimL family protein N-acetyltransferase
MGAMLRGDLVRLRPVDVDRDLEPCYEWFNDLEVTRFLSIVGPPITRTGERAVLERHGVPTDGSCFFAIEADDGATIGNCALHRISYLTRAAVLGITIGDKRYWSRGYGTDAVKTLCAYAFVELNLQRIGLSLFASNARALRCYEKAGLQVEGRLRRACYGSGVYDDLIMMGVLREEFLQRFPQLGPKGVSLR